MVEQVVLSDDRLSEAFLLLLSVSLERTHFDLCRVRPSITAPPESQSSFLQNQRKERPKRAAVERASVRERRLSVRECDTVFASVSCVS